MSGRAHTAAAVLASALGILAPNVAHAQFPSIDSSTGSLSSCIDCHATRSEARLRAPLWGEHVGAHQAAGVRCPDCHGGDPAEPSVRAHSLVLGFIGIPDALGTSRLCGRCHDGSRAGTLDVAHDHRAGAHGRAIAMGRTAAATCTSCHGAHGIAPVDDAAAPTARTSVVVLCEGCHASAERLGGAELALDVATAYGTSVHGVALAHGSEDAPTCVDCHGPHDNAAGLRATLACGTCHEEVRAAFDEGPHATVFDRLGFVDCAECHGSHDIRAADASLLTGLDAACSRCHGPEQEVATRVEALTTLGSRLDVLRRENAPSDPARVSAVAAIHRLDAEALTAALAGIEAEAPVADARDARETPRPAHASALSWQRSAAIAVALGVAVAALVAWVIRRRTR